MSRNADAPRTPRQCGFYNAAPYLEAESCTAQDSVRQKLCKVMMGIERIIYLQFTV